MGWDIEAMPWGFDEGHNPVVLACYVATGAVLLLYVLGALVLSHQYPEATTSTKVSAEVVAGLLEGHYNYFTFS